MIFFLAGGPPFSIESLAAALEVSTWSARRLLPKIGYCKIGGLIRIPRENVENYLRGPVRPPHRTRLSSPAPERTRRSGRRRRRGVRQGEGEAEMTLNHRVSNPQNPARRGLEGHPLSGVRGTFEAQA